MCLLEHLALCHYSENQVEFFVRFQSKMKNFLKKNLPVLIFKAGLTYFNSSNNK